MSEIDDILKAIAVYILTLSYFLSYYFACGASKRCAGQAPPSLTIPIIFLVILVLMLIL